MLWTYLSGNCEMNRLEWKLRGHSGSYQSKPGQKTWRWEQEGGSEDVGLELIWHAGGWDMEGEAEGGIPDACWVFELSGWLVLPLTKTEKSKGWNEFLGKRDSWHTWVKRLWWWVWQTEREAVHSSREHGLWSQTVWPWMWCESRQFF